MRAFAVASGSSVLGRLLQRLRTDEGRDVGVLAMDQRHQAARRQLRFDDR